MNRTRIGAVLILLIILLGITLGSCAPCSHTDGDGDYICDDCGADIDRVACSEHEDTGCDGRCDICERVVAIEHIDTGADGICDKCGACTEHIDTACDGACDRCSATMRIQHIDEDGDKACDKCLHCITGHTDEDCDGVCDKDGASVEIIHRDLSGDGVCDKCHRCTSTHLDEDCDGVCDMDSATVAIVHIDKNNDNICDKCQGAVCIHEYEDGSTVCKKCGKAMDKISYTAKKTASVGRGVTLYPTHTLAYNSAVYRGAQVEYTFRIKNTGNVKMTANISDTLPEGARLVSGCDNVDGRALIWALDLAVGEEKEISYTIEVTADRGEGGVLPGSLATVNGEAVSTYDLYIAPTLNDVDKEYITKAIRILSVSTYTGIDFAKHAYTIAFTNAKAITTKLTGTPTEALAGILAGDSTLSAMVAPGLYGGTSAPTDIDGIMGERADCVTTSDLVAGDIIIANANGKCSMYIYATGEMYDITGRAVRVDSAATLASLDNALGYAVIRPSLTMTSFTPSDPDELPEAMDKYQEALVKTAETYLLRGESLQYDDTRFGLTGSSSTNTSGEYRWEIDVHVPEDYTTTEWGYLNCAAFTYEVYRNALGYALPREMYTTYNLSKFSNELDMRTFCFTNDTPGEYTEEYKLQIEREFMDALEVGDIVVVRRSNNNGHAMLYVGNGRLVHSGGGSYSQTSGGVGYEVYEPTIRCHKVTDYIFDPSSVGGNPFRTSDEYGEAYVTELILVRPLNVFDGEIPEATTERIENMQDIRAEKTSSHSSSVTVNVGDEITYTFSLYNIGKADRVISISDKIPTGTSLLSGCDNVSGDSLAWSVTVGAGATVKVSYTVKVGDLPDGTAIASNDAKIGGVAYRCATIYVRRTLTAAEQEEVIDAIATLKTEGVALDKLALVNEIYKRALGIENDIFLTTDISEVMTGEDGVFITSTHKIGSKAATEINTDESAYYRSMLADGLYGGYRVYSGQLKHDRTRLVMEQNLVVGDIIVGRTSSAERIFMYVGDATLICLYSTSTIELFSTASSFSTICENIMYYGRDFAVLRPSMVLD